MIDCAAMKLSVYVPDDLAERLTAVKDRINVSEVCQAALSTAVAAAESARLGDERPTIIERLRRARTPEEQLSDRGFADGRRWAAESAALTDLKAIASPGTADSGAAGLLVALGFPDGGKLAYVIGFREGARAVWDSVRSELGQ